VAGLVAEAKQAAVDSTERMACYQVVKQSVICPYSPSLERAAGFFVGNP
jgi:hypothetical protein